MLKTIKESINFIQTLLKTNETNQAKLTKLRTYHKDLNNMHDSVLWHSNHWCQHCVKYHLNNEFNKLDEINQIIKKFNAPSSMKSPKS